MSNLGDEAIDTLGFLLRSFAGMDGEKEERDELEAWARHCLMQAPVPGHAHGNLPPGRRDWKGMRERVLHIITHRNLRSTRAVEDLRETVTVFTRSLSKALDEDRGSDDATRNAMESLKSAAEAESPEQLKECALSAVGTMNKVLEERERRYEKRIAEVSDRARSLEGKLTEAEKEQYTDPLTKVMNRRGFDRELDRALEATRTFNERNCLILYDLDRFKRINDGYGHVAGDVVLSTFANTLAVCFPRRGDCVARYGGEEFGIILRGAALQDAHRLAERSLEAVRRLEVDLGDDALKLTTSAGVTELRSEDSPQSVVARADQGLYRAKHEGRDRSIVV